MITYASALKIIVESSKPLDTVRIPCSGAVGFVSRENLFCPMDVPSFHNTAMDGFAVRSEETAPISPSQSRVFRVLGAIAAGDPPSLQPTVESHVAWEIMTGAPMPNGFDAVVPVEQVEIRKLLGSPTEIVVDRPVAKHSNVRFAGEDFEQGDLFLTSGTRLMPEHMMALSTFGVENVLVSTLPTVALISTGRELVDRACPELDQGKIRNSTAPYLMAVLQRWGLPAAFMGTVADDPKDFFKYIDTISERRFQVVITTGAVSAGRYDFVTPSLKDVGARVLFHKVAIRPGKPILFATLPGRNGGEDTTFFGLPGNPVSSAVGFRFFVEPHLRARLGLPQERFLKATLTADTRKPEGLRCFFKAKLNITEAGGSEVSVLAGQPSFMVSPLLKANAWAILPEEGSMVSAGTIVDVAPLHALPYAYSGESVGND